MSKWTVDQESQQEQMRWYSEGRVKDSLRLVQREEALSRPPTLAQFGREAFAHRGSALSPDIDQSWSMYQQVVDPQWCARQQGLQGAGNVGERNVRHNVDGASADG